MMYLSQCVLPLADALDALVKDFGAVDNYAWHQWVWRRLPERPEAQRDFLFRIDMIGKPTQVRVLLLSAVPPVDETWQTKEVSERFLEYGAYRFHVRANPTFRENAGKHRRLALFKEEEIREWFTRKFADMGCQIRQLETGAAQRQYFRKGPHPNKCWHSAVDAKGNFVVVDQDKFKDGFRKGLGPAKGFGFGLLMLQHL